MSLAEGVYCALTDLLKGDLELPRYMGDGSSFVNLAAEDIDARIGHMYITPVAISDSEPKNRPSKLLLKRINALLASGRMLLDIATAGESTDLHAYGRSLVKEALDLLEKIVSGEMILRGAETIDEDSDDKNFTGPVITNEDPISMVEAFYKNHNPLTGPMYPQPISPYGG